MRLTRRGGAQGSTDRASYSEGAAFGVLSFASLAVVGLLSGILVARIYGIEIVGLFALASAPFMTLNSLSSVREQAALVRELTALEARAPRVTGLFTAVLAFSVGLTLAVALPVAVITYFVFSGPVGQPDLFAPALALLGAYLLIRNTSWNLDMVFSSFRAGRNLFWIRLDEGVSLLVLSVAGGLIWRSVWVLVAATALAWGVALVHRVVRVRRLMRLRVPADELRSGFRSLPPMIRFGLKLAPGSAADGLATQAGIWILGATASVAAVGAYNRAWNLASRFVGLNYRITEMLFPTLVERRSGGDQSGFSRALTDSMRYAGAGMLLPAAVGGGAAYGIMAIYGPGFDRAANALAVLLLVPAVLSVSGIVGHALTAVDRPLTGSLTAVVRTAVIVTATALIAGPLGATGVALALLVPYAAEVVWRTLLIARHLPDPLRSQWRARELLAIPMAYAASFAAARLIDVSMTGALGLILALACGTLAYPAVLLAFGGLNERDRGRLTSVRDRLMRRPGPAPADASG